MITQEQVNAAAKAVTAHTITQWKIQGDNLVVINSIGQKFVIPLPAPDLRATPKPHTKKGGRSGQ